MNNDWGVEEQCNPYDNTRYLMEELESSECISLHGNNGRLCYVTIIYHITRKIALWWWHDGIYIKDMEGYLCIDGLMMGTTDADASECGDDETCYAKN